MKNTASLTIKRAGATLAIAGALLAMTGCTYTNNPATTLVYAASDGQKLNLAGENDAELIQLRNIMVISAEEGTPGRVLGTILNQTEDDATVTLAFPSETLTVEVPAGKEVRLEDEANALTLTKTDVAPGLTIRDVEVTSTVTGEPGTFNVPVLNGDLEEYAEYLPGGAPTAEATASANH